LYKPQEAETGKFSEISAQPAQMLRLKTDPGTALAFSAQMPYNEQHSHKQYKETEDMVQ